MKQSDVNKILHRTLKEIGKKYGWQSHNGFVFTKKERLFFVLLLFLEKDKIRYSLDYKFYDFDEVFWNIVGMEENLKQPLSLHARGAFTAPTMRIYDSKWIEIGEWDKDILVKKLNDIFQKVESISNELAKKVTTLDENLEYLQNLLDDILQRSPKAVTNIFIERLITAVLKKDFALGLKIIQERIAQCDGGGFIIKGQSFYELAKKYIENRNQ